jgi:hypothetical protein
MAAALAKQTRRGRSLGRTCYAMATRLPVFARSRNLSQVC